MSRKKKKLMICWHPYHPEYHGKICACSLCHAICVDDPCSFCEGPVKIPCDHPKDNHEFFFGEEENPAMYNI